MKLGAKLLIALDNRVQIGVCVSKTEKMIDGKEKLFIGVVTLREHTEVELQCQEEDLCEITAYCTREMGEFTDCKINQSWAERKIAEISAYPEPVIPSSTSNENIPF